MKKTAIYCRVSTDKQELDQQIDSCKKFCEYKGYDFTCFSDVGSGKNMVWFNNLNNRKKDWVEIDLGRDFFNYNKRIDWCNRSKHQKHKRTNRPNQTTLVFFFCSLGDDTVLDFDGVVRAAFVETRDEDDFIAGLTFPNS